eukprot:353960_1
MRKTKRKTEEESDDHKQIELYQDKAVPLLDVGPIQLHINYNAPTESNGNGDDQNEEKYILLQTKQSSMNENNRFKLKYIEYSLNELKTEIIVNQLNESPVINDKTNNICLCYKYRHEYIMNHRKQRYNIVLIPIYIMFIIFCIFVYYSINSRINTSTMSYINPSINIQFRSNVSESELEEIKNCGIDSHDLYGWFDALSFDFAQKRWIDYSPYKNDIDASNIHNKIKLGSFYDNANNVYIYGSKLDFIQMPSALYLNKTNYTIMTVARYNGNDRDTIFISNDSKWIFGFANNKTNILYHDGFIIEQQMSNLIYTATNNKWIVSVDSPNIYRSQQHTHYQSNDSRSNNTKDEHAEINWGINIFNSSDWGVATILLFTHQLSLSQIQCMENILFNKYELSSNVSNYQAGNHDLVTTEQTKNIYECDRWKSGFVDDYIIGWYDANNGFDLSTHTLFDLSKLYNNYESFNGSTDILLDENIKIGINEFNKDFRYLYGATNNVISIPISIDTNNVLWTAIHYVARYNGNDRGSILSDISSHFFCGFYNESAGVCELNEQSISEFREDVYGDEWVLSSFYYHFESNDAFYCTQNCKTSFKTNNPRILDDTLMLTINGEKNTDWAFTEIIIVQITNNEWHFIPFVDTMCIEEYLSNKYHVDSYRYNIHNITALQACNWFCIIFIIIGSIFVNWRLKYGFVGKLSSDTITHTFQAFNICCYFCCDRCCCCCTCCIHCCCGALQGICTRHCCGCQISIFPIYNVCSVISSITSIIHRIIYSKNEVFFYLLLNGCITCSATIIHFVFIYQYLIGDSETLDDYPFFYFIEFEMCIFLWCIMIINSFRHYIYDFYWIIILSTYSYLL